MLQLFIYLFLIYNCNAFYILFQPNIAKSNILMLDNMQAKQKWLNNLNDEPSWLKNKQTNILMLDNMQAKQKWLNSLNDEPSWLKNKQINILKLDNVEAKQKWLNSLNDEPSWLKNKQNINTKENYLENIKLNILEAKKKILEAESNINYLLKY